MIRFLPQANFTWAQCEDYQEQKFLHKALTVICPHRYKVKAYRDGHWNGMWYFLEDDDHFLTGLLPKVLRIADRQEFKYLVVNEEDVRVVGQDLINLKAGYLNVLWPLHKWSGGPDMSGFEERDYQQQAIYKAVMAQRGVIEVGTGGGKTVIAGGIIKELDLSTLFLMGSTKILAQTVETFGKFGFDVGQIGGGKSERGHRVTAATVQSVQRLLRKGEADDLMDCDVIFWDEVHHAGADTWRLTGEHSRARFRFGLSGTPFRGNGWEYREDIILQGITGQRIVYIPSHFLRKKGYLSEPYVSMVPVQSCPSLKRFKWENDWHLIYSMGIVENTRRNDEAVNIAKQLYKQGHKILVIVKHIDHGDALMRGFANEGIETEFLKGGDQIRSLNGGSIEEREEPWDETREALENKDEWIRIASPVMDEGVDLPSISAIVLLAGGKSPIKTIQRVGRGLRRTDESGTVLVFDFEDQYHGILHSHSQQRKRWYKKHRFNIEDGISYVNRLLDEPLILLEHGQEKNGQGSEEERKEETPGDEKA